MHESIQLWRSVLIHRDTPKRRRKKVSDYDKELAERRAKQQAAVNGGYDRPKLEEYNKITKKQKKMSDRIETR